MENFDRNINGLSKYDAFGGSHMRKIKSVFFILFVITLEPVNIFK